MSVKASRKGVLGGTFNPVHIGHLHLAQVALKALDLDEILFIPAYSPPHKKSAELCGFNHRVAMLEMAVEPYPEFQVSCLEAEREGFSYTIDTLRTLHDDLCQNDELIFLMGFDAFQEMGTWKDFLGISQYATIAVCARDGSSISTTAQDLFGDDAALIQEFTVPEKKVSSSSIRALLTTHPKRAASFVPYGVFSYIEEYGLYL